MRNFRFWTAMLLLAPPVALLNGCGGGGGGGSSTPQPGATATPIPTATVGARVLVVQLRDRANNPVEGVVSIGSAPVAGVSVLATSGGSATFNRNVPAGNLAVSAEVDGDITTGTAAVSNGGTTIFTLTISTRITPAPMATLPPAPFPT